MCNMQLSIFRILVYLIFLLSFGSAQHYPWLQSYDRSNSITRQIDPPPGYRRAVPSDSFALWLRGLPLKPGNPPVYLFDGSKKRNQNAHFAVIDIDVGRRDLQQCADALIRLKAEYWYSRNELGKITFTYTNGDSIPYNRWAAGERPIVERNRVRWTKKSDSIENYQLFRRYLNNVFVYAGTISLKSESRPLKTGETPQPGDFFIQAGSPGHAILIVDLVINPKTGRKLFLLVQSYMPAQDIHLLKNPADRQPSPWYDIDFDKNLVTPEWRFSGKDLRRFRSSKF